MTDHSAVETAPQADAPPAVDPKEDILAAVRRRRPPFTQKLNSRTAALYALLSRTLLGRWLTSYRRGGSALLALGLAHLRRRLAHGRPVLALGSAGSALRPLAAVRPLY